MISFRRFGASATCTKEITRVGSSLATGYFLWFAAVNWDDLKRSDRHLVEAIKTPVVWVDTPRSPLRGGRWLPTNCGDVRVMREKPLILRVTPSTVPFMTRPGFRVLANRYKRFQVQRLVGALGFGPTAVVVSSLEDIYGRWGSDTLEVLRGSDDYVAGAKLMGVSARRLARMEQKALHEAGLVFAASDRLAEKWRASGVEPRILPNGCAPVPEDLIRQTLTSRGHPLTVGLIGHLSERIDINVLEEIATAQYRLVLIGPKDRRWEPKRFAALTSKHNVEYLGRIAPEAIAARLREIDVAITPYSQSNFNRASNPLKTLEYLAAGVPVVTSDLPAARWLKDEMVRSLGTEAVQHHLAIVNSPSETVEAIARLARDRSLNLDLERWRFASLHSWDRRASEMQALMEEAITDLPARQWSAKPRGR